MNFHTIGLRNEGASVAIHYELVSLYREADENESDDIFYLNGKYLYKDNRSDVSDNIMNFSNWIALRYNIFDIGKYNVSHYMEYLDKFKHYDSYIKMKIENDLQILQLAIIRHFHKKYQYPNMFITNRNLFDIVYCPYCNSAAQLKFDHEVYGKSYGNNLYVCDNCEAQISTYGRSIVPKGTLANQKLRELRMSCYNVIQNYIEKNSYKRMLQKLTELLEIKEVQARISTLNIKQCNLILQHF